MKPISLCGKGSRNLETVQFTGRLSLGIKPVQCLAEIPLGRPPSGDLSDCPLLTQFPPHFYSLFQSLTCYLLP